MRRVSILVFSKCASCVFLLLASLVASAKSPARPGANAYVPVVSAPFATCGNADATAAVNDAGTGAAYTWTVEQGVITSGQGTREITFHPTVPPDTGNRITVSVSIGGPAAGTASTTVEVARPNAWHSIGGFGGSFTSVAFDPTNPTRVLAAGSGGVFRSFDAGLTWERVAPWADASSLSFVPGSVGVVYLTASSAIRRSADGGSTWSSVETYLGSTYFSVSSLALDGASSPYLYAVHRSDSMTNHVRVSKDAGATWAAAEGLPSGIASPLLVADPTQQHRVYAVYPQGIYRTLDGSNWSLASAVNFSVLAVDPADGTLYGGRDAARSGDAFRSTDGGVTWTPLGLGNDVFAIAVADDEVHTLYCVTRDTGFRRSVDGGATWDQATGIAIPADYASIRAIAVAPSPAPQLLVAGDMHLWRSEDGGSTFSVADETILSAGVSRYALAPDGSYWASAAGGIFVSTDAHHWSLVSPATLGWRTFGVAFGSDASVWAATWQGLMRSVDRGATWTRIDAFPLPTASDVTILASGRIVVSSLSGGVLLSDDNGSTWVRPLTDACTDLASNAQSNVLFATLATGVLARSVDGGETWTTSITGLPAMSVRTVAIDPETGQNVLVGGLDASVQGGPAVIARSTNGGASFTAIPSFASFPRGVQALAFDPRDGDYVVANVGGSLKWEILESLDSGATWQRRPEEGWLGDALPLGRSTLLAALPASGVAFSNRSDVPSVTSASPMTAGSAGGDLITLRGTGFVPGVKVYFDHTLSPAVTFVSATEITAIAPPHVGGVPPIAFPVSITVENPNCASTLWATGFSYVCDNAPTATISGTTTICAGQPATLRVALTGSAPWRLTWSDGFVQENLSLPNASRVVRPRTTTRYTVMVSSADCVSGTTTGEAVVTIAPADAWIHAPLSVCPQSVNVASLQTNVPGSDISWSATGATIVGSSMGSEVRWIAGSEGVVTLFASVSVGSCRIQRNVQVSVTRFAEAEWTPIGPVDKYYYSLSTDSRGFVAAASPASALFSIDSGLTWIEGQGFQSGASSDRFARDATSGAILRWGGCRLLRSDDGGQRWRSIGLPDCTLAAAFDVERRKIFIANEIGFFESADLGVSWRRVSSDTSTAAQVRSLHFDPVVEGRILAVGDDAIHRSSDGGVSWQPVSLPVPNVSFRLAFNAADGDDWIVDSDATVLHRTRDGGATWSQLPPRPNVGSTFIMIDPARPATLFISTKDGAILRSIDDGATWEVPFTFGGRGILSSPPTFSANANGELWAASSGRIARSTDHGETWIVRNEDVAGGRVSMLQVGPSQTLFAGHWKRMANTAEWIAAVPTELSGWIEAFGFPSADESTQYACCSPMDGWKVVRTTDGGTTWSVAASAPDRVRSFSVDRTTGRFYAATQSGIWVSNDSGSTWNATAVIPQNILQVRTAPGIAFAIANGAVYRSTSSGSTWQEMPAIASATEIASNVDASAIYALTEAGIARSTDGGASWIQLPNVPAGPFRSLAVSSQSGSVVVAARGLAEERSRIYRSLDNGATWSSLGSVRGDTAALAVGGDGRIYAASTEEGVLVEVPVSSPELTTITPTSAPMSAATHVEIAGTGLTSQTTITVGGYPLLYSYATPSGIAGYVWSAVAGPADVVATSADCSTSSLVGAFLFSGGPGDANNDGAVGVSDVFYAINSMFGGGPALGSSGDANGDGSVTVTDIFYLVNYLFAAGPPPVGR